VAAGQLRTGEESMELTDQARADQTELRGRWATPTGEAILKEIVLALRVKQRFERCVVMRHRRDPVRSRQA